MWHQNANLGEQDLLSIYNEQGLSELMDERQQPYYQQPYYPGYQQPFQPYPYPRPRPPYYPQYPHYPHHHHYPYQSYSQYPGQSYGGW